MLLFHQGILLIMKYGHNCLMTKQIRRCQILPFSFEIPQANLYQKEGIILNFVLGSSKLLWFGRFECLSKSDWKRFIAGNLDFRSFEHLLLNSSSLINFAEDLYFYQQNHLLTLLRDFVVGILKVILLKFGSNCHFYRYLTYFK